MNYLTVYKQLKVVSTMSYAFAELVARKLVCHFQT